MSLTIKEVEHVALLARLSLNDAEKQTFAQQLSAILNYVDKLNELDTKGIEPLSHILPVHNVFREDTARPGAPRDEMLANAPLVDDGQYKVPRIM